MPFTALSCEFVASQHPASNRMSAGPHLPVQEDISQLFDTAVNEADPSALWSIPRRISHHRVPLSS